MFLSFDKTIFFGEYECTGPGESYQNRVSYSKRLTENEAAPYLDLSYIDGKERLLPQPSLTLHSLDTNNKDDSESLSSF
ncbi:putative pectinesterase 50 [Bienertia sinuspersici]